MNVRECDVTQIFISSNIQGCFTPRGRWNEQCILGVVIVSTRQQQEKFIVIRGRLFLRSNRNPRYHGPSRQLFRNISLVQRKRSFFFFVYNIYWRKCKTTRVFYFLSLSFENIEKKSLDKILNIF